MTWHTELPYHQLSSPCNCRHPNPYTSYKFWKWHAYPARPVISRRVQTELVPAQTLCGTSLCPQTY